MGKENNHILIKVTPNFIEKNSMIEFNKYVFAYEVEIKNESSQPIQLISRHWRKLVCWRNCDYCNWPRIYSCHPTPACKCHSKTCEPKFINKATLTFKY